jgi:hypothetical protein
MRTTARPAVLLLVASALASAACGQDGPRAHPLEGGAAPIAPATGQPDPHAQLPAGHPPMTAPTQPAGPSGGKPPATTGGAFTWTAPEGWVPGAASGMRAAEWNVPGGAAGESPSQVVVFRGIGGSTESNIDRWIGFVTQADGSPSKDKAKITTTTENGIKVTRLEVRGGYSSTMGTPVNFPEAVFLGAVIEAEGMATAHVRFVGSPAVVEKDMAKFDAFVASFRK